MSLILTQGAVTAQSSYIVPVVMAAAGYKGTNFAVTAYSFANGIGTLTISGTFPQNGFQPGSNNLQGSPTRQGGQQVVLWGFADSVHSEALNGKTVTVIANNPALGIFSFYFAGQDGYSGSESAALAAPRSLNPGLNGVRAVRIECGQGLSTDILYVGDLNLSSTQYLAALSLAGQLVVEIAGENIPADQIFILSSASNAGDTAQCTLLY